MRDIFTLFLHAPVTIIQSGAARWTPARCCRVRPNATSSPYSESRPEARSEPPDIRSCHCRLVHSTDASGTGSTVGDRLEAGDSAAFSQNVDPAKISAPVFTQTRSSARSQRTDKRTDRRGRPNETAQSHLGMQANCSANRSSLWRRHRQRRGPPDSRNTFPIQNLDRQVRPGFPISAIAKTRCGRWICFDANRRYYERTGFWW
jgi:hypothetical protein